MKIRLTSGDYGKAICTKDYNFAGELSNDLLSTIQDVWDSYHRKNHYSLRITDGTTTVLIGTNMNGTGSLVEWYNPDEKVGGKIHDGKKMCASAWMSILNFVYCFFGIPENNNDLEWENTLELSEFENDAMCKLNDAVENARSEIKDAENAIERELQYGTWTDSEIIGEAAQKAYDAIVSVKKAAVDFISKMSKYTGCDFSIPDAYSELFVDTPKFYFDIEDDMSVEDVFYGWLSRNVCGSDDADELCETLYHYLAAA